MPKYQFQRPLPVRYTHNVPRHGAPAPQRKLEVRRTPSAREPSPVPALEGSAKAGSAYLSETRRSWLFTWIGSLQLSQ